MLVGGNGPEASATDISPLIVLNDISEPCEPCDNEPPLLPPEIDECDPTGEAGLASFESSELSVTINSESERPVTGNLDDTASS